ncbi:MAG: DUF374 domain-containing protein [Deltaproteobacteria bacterium]|nr:DUF374 domain-containing protein [Deltaproteobacteria bacterium]
MSWLLGWLIAVVVQMLRLTWRVQHVGANRAMHGVFAYFHGDLLALVGCRRDVRLLISNSRDGQLAARACRALGYAVVRGSSSRGGVVGALGLVRQLRRRRSVAIAVDGPKGPREQINGSPLRLAAMAKARLFPVVARADRAWRLKSWDRLLVPKPFARVVVVWGEAVDDQDDLHRALTALPTQGQQLLARREPGWRCRARRLVVLALPLLLCCQDGPDLLSSDRAAIRVAELQRIGERNQTARRDAVARALDDPSTGVRVQALRTLGKLGAGRHLGKLLRYAAHPQLRLKLAALYALGAGGRPAEVQPALVAALEDRRRVVRRAARDSLLRLGVARDALWRQIAERRLELNRKRLRHPAAGVRLLAVAELARSRETEAIQLLNAALADRDPTVAVAAIEALARADVDPRSKQQVIALIDRMSLDQRLAVLPALERLGMLRAPAVDELLASPLVDETLRALAPTRWCPSAAQQPLICGRAVGENNDASAIAVLRRCKAICSAQHQALIAKLKEDDPAAIAILASLAWKAPGALQIAQQIYQSFAARRGRWLSAQVWRAFDDADAVPSAQTRPPVKGSKQQRLARLLDRFERVDDDQDPLLPAAVEEERAVQAVHFAARCAEEDASAWLIKVFLESDVLALARVAASELLALGGPLPAQLSQRVVALSEDRRASARLLAMRLCPRLGAQGAAIASRLATDAVAEVRVDAARCLAKLRDPLAVDLLIKLLDGVAADAAVGMLAELGVAKAASPLQRRLQRLNDDASDDERALLLRAVGASKAEGAEMLIDEHLLDPRWKVRLAAAEVLAASGKASASRLLAGCQADFDYAVRRVCKKAAAPKGGGQ